MTRFLRALRLRLPVLCLVAMLAACATAKAPSPSSADARAIIAAVEAMYAAWARDDLEAFHAVATPDFHAFDNGRRYDGDALAQVLREAHAAGRIHVWRVTVPEVHVDGDTAWVAYVNRGSIRQGNVAKDATWLESAVLRRERGRWKVAFLHSTRVP